MAEIASLDALEQLFVRQRAHRVFTSQPVENELVERLLDAATRAPSAKNVQCMRFVVVRDPARKAELGALFDEQAAAPGAAGPTPWSEVPVLIFVCSEDPFGKTATGQVALAGSIYPGIQNLLLAAQAAGLGAVLTTSRGKIKEKEIRTVLGIPENTEIHAVIPIGWPAVKLGKNRRKPVSEVAYRESYGSPW